MPGSIVAEQMEQEVYLLLGCVSGSAGSGFMLGPRRGERTTGCIGGSGLLVVLRSWCSAGALVNGGDPELLCQLRGGPTGPRA